MDTQLAKVFVQRGIIRQGTIIEAYRSARGLSCICDSYAYTRYVVLQARAVRTEDAEWVYFDVIDSRKDRSSVRSDYIACIDGMAIERVAGAHHLNPDGSVMVATTPRGRRKASEPTGVCLPAVMVALPSDGEPPK